MLHGPDLQASGYKFNVVNTLHAELVFGFPWALNAGSLMGCACVTWSGTTLYESLLNLDYHRLLRFLAESVSFTVR